MQTYDNDSINLKTKCLWNELSQAYHKSYQTVVVKEEQRPATGVRYTARQSYCTDTGIQEDQRQGG